MVIPILSLGKKGDQVLLISSSTAEQQGWTARISQFLTRHGFEILPPLRVDDDLQLDPFKISGLISRQIPIPQTPFEHIFIHLNGGQKMTAIGLFEAVKDLPAIFVYMDHQPVQLLVIDHKKARYQPVDIRLSLSDLLALYGSQVAEKSEPVVLEGGELPALAIDKNLASAVFKLYDRPDEPEQTEKRKILNYLEDMQQIVSDLSLKYSRNKNFAFTPLGRFLRKPTNETCPSLNETALRNFLRSELLTFYKQLKNLTTPGNSTGFNITLSHNEINALHSNGFIDAGDSHSIQPSQVKKGLGSYFEQQVLQRLQKFLSDHAEYEEIISEIHSGVKIEALDNPWLITGEYDILFFLRNGIAISLECKSFLFEEKDLFSRITRLTSRTSILSQQWLVIPFYTEPELSQPRMLKNYLGLKKLNIPVIPFGRKGQPREFLPPESDSRLIIPDFEEAIAGQLKGFLKQTLVR